MATTQSPMPVRNPMITPDGLVSRQWRTWLRNRTDIVNETPVRIGGVSLTEQAASIAPQAIPMTITGGVYRVSVFAQRTTLASGGAPSASALGVIVYFRSHGQPLSVATDVSASNLLNELVVGNWLIRCDPESVISYEAVYTSVAPGTMTYSLDIVVEAVQA